jgi:hypothetical protein
VQLSSIVDTLIALVLVLLLLSLMAQSIQELLKRLLRLKARQLELVLADFFRKSFDGGQEKLTGFMRTTCQDLGRTTLLRQKPLGGEFTKDDLRRWIDESNADDIVPGSEAAFAQLRQAAQAIREALGAFPDPALTGPAGGSIAVLRSLLDPVLKPVLDEQAATAGAIQKLPLLSVSTAVGTISTIQQTLPPELQPAHSVAGELPKLLSNFEQAFRALLDPISKKRQALGDWFDAAMIAFNERYQRNMRVWTFIIGLAVAVSFNASIIHVAKAAFSSDVVRQVILQNQAQIEKLAKIQCSGEEKQVRECLEAKIRESAALTPALGLNAFDYQSITDLGSFLLHVLGWLLTTILIGVGAPFWQDVLQSLFGLKNILRKPAAPEPASIGQNSSQPVFTA